MKPGIKTTEFWLCLVIVAVNAALASGVLPAAHWSVQAGSALVAGAAAIGYTVARARVKVQEVLGPSSPPPAPPA